ncbi:DUF4270 family protein [Chryseobacterium vrystaatense]|uniref:DUF4270 domain-containing protein n=2 Tax=Chryseobacterium vrystaatense TaxID=307480 RepID=A0A1M4ZBG0_9FLAO|nr:DUF4270 family protein [Chryseobacterium vrystaatense]SHF15383.1 protein of unknown function [Chryseobacterium vrystaatense]
MTYTVKRTLAMLFMAVFGSALLYNCEPEADSLGEQLFIDGAAQGNETSYPLIAYNINNNDTIRSDASRLLSIVSETNSTAAAVLGAFDEGQFGMQKASFLAQLRMSTDNFEFGKTPKIDSVVLVMKPAYVPDSIVTRPVKDENLLVGTETVPVSTVVKEYPVDYQYKYGKMKLGPGGTNTLLHINVDEVTTFLDGNNDAFKRSNVTVNTGTALGSTVFNGTVTAKTITKKSDNSTLFTSTDPAIRIRLDKDFFQTKILDKNGKPELMDAANFTRHFKGIRLSVTDTDGYLLQFNPDSMEVVMYYTNEKNDNGTITRPQFTFKLNIAGNTRFGQYQYNRGTSAWGNALTQINPTDGDKKLYIQGMGGPSIAVKIPDQTITDLKKLYNDNKAAIVSAKIRMYADPSWENNYLRKDRKFNILPLDNINPTTKVITYTGFTQDQIAGLDWLKDNKKPEYYDFVITKTVKDIVEGTLANNTLIVNAGKFTPTDTGKFLGYKYTLRAFAMERGVYVGTDKNNSNSIQLKIIYGTKK